MLSKNAATTPLLAKLAFGSAVKLFIILFYVVSEWRAAFEAIRGDMLRHFATGNKRRKYSCQKYHCRQALAGDD